MISFQERDAFVPELSGLEAFSKMYIMAMLATTPGLEAAEWKPKGLGNTMTFVGADLVGKGKDRALSHRLLILHGGSGFYALDLAVARPEDFARPEFEKFFSSIRMGGREKGRAPDSLR